MADYSRQIRKALRIIRRRGQSCTFMRYQVALPDNPWEQVIDTPTRVEVHIFFTTAGQQTLYRADTTVAKGGYTGLMGNYGFEPSLKDWVVRGDEQLTLKDVISVKLNEQTIYYQLALNR